MEPRFEEQFTAYIDLLGLKNAIKTDDERAIKAIGDLLSDLSGLRGEFDVRTKGPETFPSIIIKPAISTFSDNIVISYPLQPTITELGVGESLALLTIMQQINFLLKQIAVKALRIGLLVRGGATIGNLYHTTHAVFGKALVDAYEIESQVSKYPRVVLSHEITRRLTTNELEVYGIRGDDGLYHFDYFKQLAKSPAIPADSTSESVNAWNTYVNKTVAENIAKSQGKLAILAKWAWFANEFRSGIDRSKSQRVRPHGGAVSWPDSPGSDSETQGSHEPSASG